MQPTRSESIPSFGPYFNITYIFTWFYQGDHTAVARWLLKYWSQRCLVSAWIKNLEGS